MSVASSYQTVKLAAGRHRSADDGVCAMELASMLAGQPFSDRPSCVCPVVSAFLRGYNDGLPDGARQALLLRWCSEAVGTRSRRPEEVQRRLAAVDQAARDIVPVAKRATLSRVWGRIDWLTRAETIGVFCARRAARDPEVARRVDALLEELCRTEHADVRWRRQPRATEPVALPPLEPALQGALS